MSNPKISFAFSLIATFFGSIALFSNYWFQGPYWNAGFIEGCALDVCVSTQSTFSWNGDKVGSVLKKYYILGVIGLIYLPLVMIASAAALKGVSLYCPSESRGVSATVCAWIAAYHGIGLVIFFIALAGLRFELKNIEGQSDSNDGYELNRSSYMNGMASDMRYGWSAYVGLFATIFGLESAVTSCQVCSKDEKEQTHEENDVNEYTHEDTAALTSHVV